MKEEKAEKPIIIEEVIEEKPAEPEEQEVPKKPVKKPRKRSMKKPRKKASRKKTSKKPAKDDEEESMFSKAIIFAGIVFVLLLIVLIKVFTNHGTAISGELAGRNLSSVNNTVNIEMYMDISCEYSKEAWDSMIKLKSVYGDNLQINVRQFPMSMDDVVVANAVLCANDQKKQMQYINRLFDNQDSLDVNSLKNYAWAEGLDVVAFHDCVDNNKHIDRIRQDLKEGYEKGVRSTPVFFVDGKMLTGVQPIDKFQTLIDEKLGI